MALTPERHLEYDQVVESARVWASAQTAIRALALVGSYARGEAAMSSDIDLVVLADDVEAYVAGTDWIRPAAGQNGRVVRSQGWGPLSERRVELASGFLVEYGFALTSWASVDPVDDGTAMVVADGFRILYDPEGMLDRLATAVERLRA